MKALVPWWLLLALAVCPVAGSAGAGYVEDRFNYTVHRFASGGEIVLPWRVHEMAQVGDRVCAIVWCVDGRDTSLVASTELGQDEWESFDVPGRAYLLDQPEPVLCSIHDNGEKSWILTLHDLKGVEKRRVVHPYATRPREYKHFLPYPVGMEDGSLALVCSYYYETRNPLLLLPLMLLSGGHGSRPDWAWYLDLVEAKRPAAGKQILKLATFEDAGYRRIVARALPGAGSNLRPTRELQKGQDTILEYEHVETNAACFMSGNRVICCGEETKGDGDCDGACIVAPIPPGLQNGGRPWDGPVAFPEHGREPGMDVKQDDAGNFYYAVSCWRESGDLELYLLTYSPETGTWKRGVVRLPAMEGHPREYPDWTNVVRLFVTSADIYMGLWYGQEPFTVIHIPRPAGNPPRPGKGLKNMKHDAAIPEGIPGR